MTVSHRNPRQIRRTVLTLEACEARVLMATAPPLGAASSFAALGGSTVTNTGATNINGDVGVSPGTSITGFPPGIIRGGTIHAGDAVATQAAADLATAYNYLVGESADTILSGQDLGGLTLAPGDYKFATSAQLSGKLTLDAQGNPNAVFVFQIGTTLTSATDSSVTLVNGARARNVFWQVGTTATLGAATAFQGSILADASIILNTGTSISPGRALAINGAVTMDTNAISSVFTTPLTITANDQTKVYGAALPVLTVTYTGFVNGDTAASLTRLPNVVTTATAASHVANNPYAIAASGAVDPDYTFTYVNGTLNVTPAGLTITANDQTKVYGAPLPTLTASYTGFVNGDTPMSLTTPPTLTTTATAASPVAGNPYPINVSGAADPDYTISYVAGALDITPGPTIGGSVFLNLNATGTIAAGDPGMAGRVVYVDLHGDGVLHADDPQALTDAEGRFTIGGLAAGQFLVQVKAFPNDDPTGPNGGYLATDTTSGRSVTDANFGLQPGSTVVPRTPTPTPFAGGTTTEKAVIESLYRTLLGRQGEPAGMADWLARSQAGETNSAIATEFLQTPEYRTDLIGSYYQTFLGRAPAPTELASWMATFQAGWTDTQVAEFFASSPEYNAIHADPSNAVESLYANLLGRDAAASEVAFWDGLLGAGMSRGVLAAKVVESTEAYLRGIDGDYTAFLARVGEAPGTSHWLGLIQQGTMTLDSVEAYFFSSPEFVTRGSASI